ncbi:MAG: hypothetical protein KAJ12_03310 [Bacteroidetes bacterium]|nr:hypothetical protein [Bacteroidota bacterium]
MNRICTACLVCLVIVPEPARGAFEGNAEGARPAALGEAVIASSGDAWAAFLNPAVLATIRQRTFGVSLVPQRFGLPELGRAAFIGVQPFVWGGISIGGTKSGFELYQEVAVRGGCALRLLEKFQFGIAITWYHLAIAGYGSAWTLGVDAGLRVVLSDRLTYAVAMSNINAPVIGSAREKIPQRFFTGLTFIPLKGVQLNLDIAKDVRYPATVKLGMEYVLLDALALRCGTSTDPSIAAFGVGVSASLITIDYAMDYHSVLGATHFFSISLRLG